jgi:hypothetical protein
VISFKANSVPKFGGILFTPIRYTAQVCYAAGPLEGQGFFMEPEWTSFSNHFLYVNTRIARSSQLTMTSPDTARFVYLSHRSTLCVEYQHWLVKRALIVDQKDIQWRTVRIHFSGVLYEYISDKTNAQKSAISTKINVYSYRIAHRRAYFSAGVICRDYLGSNMRHMTVNLLKTSGAPSNSWNVMQ